MTRASAICWFVRPAARRWRTSSSRAERGSAGRTGSITCGWSGASGGREVKELGSWNAGGNFAGETVFDDSCLANLDDSRGTLHEPEVISDLKSVNRHDCFGVGVAGNRFGVATRVRAWWAGVPPEREVLQLGGARRSALLHGSQPLNNRGREPFGSRRPRVQEVDGADSFRVSRCDDDRQQGRGHLPIHTEGLESARIGDRDNILREIFQGITAGSSVAQTTAPRVEAGDRPQRCSALEPSAAG